MNITRNDACTFCHTENETLLHLFFECRFTRSFWGQLSNLIKNKCDIDLRTWNETDILFGNRALGIALNKIIIQGKMHIYYCRIKKLRPEIANFRSYLVNNYKIEKYISIQYMKSEQFDRVWHNFANLVEIT